MPFPKSVKIAAIASQSVIVLWVVLTVLASLFQDDLLKFYIDSSTIENTNRTGSWSVIIRCIAAIIVGVANMLICCKKTVHTPLIMTSVTAGLLPVVVNSVSIRQRLVVSMDSIDEFTRLSAVLNMESILAYFLSAALLITIASGAVYAFAKKNCSEIKEDESYEITNN
ncbi:MAG: hypothetical protein J1E40_11585 [Oscillospiraceae bacterium]|nr:hypothetical protein [Oscillospiraceae bacterium]